MTDFPAEQIVEAQQPVGEAYIDLFEIALINGGHIYVKANNSATWQGHTYDKLACKLTGVETTADQKDNKPKFQAANPGNMFSALVAAGVLEKSLVYRRRVLKPHLDADLPIYQQRTWYIRRVAQCDDTGIVVELSDLSEGPIHLVPARRYEPPAFPVVHLQ
jgi:phage-related protein